MNSICAIIVTYQPSLDALSLLLQRILSDVAHIVIIDNASNVDVENSAREISSEKITVQKMSENINYGNF